MRKSGVTWLLAAVMLFVVFEIALRSMRNDPLGGDFDVTVAGVPRKLLPLLVGVVLCAAMGVMVLVGKRREKKQTGHGDTNKKP